MGIEPGSVVGGDFRVEKHLASGAMGAVYVVEQLSTGKRRAMKVMSADLASNERARERFVLEARVGSRIDSDHVVEVVSAGIDDGSGAPYLVMELLDGEELADAARRRGPYPATEVAEIFKQVGHALGRAHAQGIVHRDLKPENLFVATSRREGVPFTVKILDFGIAKLVAERTNDGTQPMGTPLYMAPEQTDRDGVIGPPTDVWPLGLIAFSLLTGKPYWEAADDTMSQLLREVVLDPLEPASARAETLGVGGRLPPGFDAWFARCVVRDPAQRFADGAACTQAFAAMITGTADFSAAQTVSIEPPAGAPVAGTDTGPAPMVRGAAGTASSSVGGAEIEAAPAGGAKGGPSPWLGVGAGVAVVAGGAIYFATAGGADPAPSTEGTVPAAATSAPAASSAAPAPKTCPAGSIEIAGGNMFMGSSAEDLEDDVRPTHGVKLSSYCLDETEVTVAAYASCLEQGKCPKPQTKVDFPGLKEASAEAYEELCNWGREGRAQHPINCVTWKEARDYCAALGGRLPTEAEWEFAARGPSQRKFPWGEEPPGPERLNALGDEHVNWQREHSMSTYGQMYEGDDGFVGTAPVKSFPKGASEAGVHDLAGNVWEWTADWYGPYTDAKATDPEGPAEGTERVVRGGGFNGLRPAWAKPAYRWKTTPEARSHGVGFRCAYDL